MVPVCESQSDVIKKTYGFNINKRRPLRKLTKHNNQSQGSTENEPADPCHCTNLQAPFKLHKLSRHLCLPIPPLHCHKVQQTYPSADQNYVAEYARDASIVPEY